MSRPPRHLADLELAERREAVAALGERAFRADQLSRHYFARYTDSPEDMTDLPVGVRTALAGELLPQLLTAIAAQPASPHAKGQILKFICRNPPLSRLTGVAGNVPGTAQAWRPPAKPAIT